MVDQISCRLSKKSPLPLFLLGLVVCFALGNCQRKKDNEKEASNHIVQSRKDSLIHQAERFIFLNPDSLRYTAEQLLKSGIATQDFQSIVKGERYKARALWSLGNHAKAMDAAIVALKDAEKWGIREEIPEIYAVIGNLHKEKANYKMALEAAGKGMKTAVAIKDTASMIYMNRLKAMFTQGMGADAKDTSLIIKSLDMHLDGLKLAESDDKFESSKIAYYNNIAQVYVKLGELDKAYGYVNQAITLAKKYNQQFSLTYSYTWLGQIYAKRGDEKQAVYYMDQALRISKELKHSFREMEVNLHKYRVLKEFRDYEEALESFSRYSEIRDSLRVLENTRQLAEVEIKYNTDQKDKQISILNSINREVSRRASWALAILCVLVILFVAVLIQYLIISKRNKLLAERNEVINAQSEKMQILMRELHHRVKNNLQIVSNLLSLQASKLKDEEAQKSIRTGQQRIEAMSLIHRSLYGHEDVSKVNMKNYISELVESIMHGFGLEPDDINLNIHCEVQDLDIDMALPVGMIINEWVTNVFKYAFTSVTGPKLDLYLAMQERLIVEIRDNGNGMDLVKWETPNDSFGIRIIKVLVRQLDGTCCVSISNGTIFKLDIPVPHMKAA